MEVWYTGVKRELEIVGFYVKINHNCTTCSQCLSRKPGLQIQESSGRYTLNLSIFDLVLSATRFGPATLSNVFESLNIVLHILLTSSSSASAFISENGPTTQKISLPNLQQFL